MPDGIGVVDPLANLGNIEVEQSLLGALFLDNRLFEHVADIVRPEDFSHPSHGMIFGEIARLVSAGVQADLVTLAARSADFGVDRRYLAQLVESVVTLLNAPHYARTIADLSRRRQIVAASQETIADASVIDPERPADKVLDEAEERLFAIGEARSTEQISSAADIAARVIAKIEDAYKRGGAITVDTGLSELDRIISGMGTGELIVLAGRPAMGKSALMGTVAFNVAKAGKRPLIFSLEMTKAELMQRWLAGLTGISTDAQRHGRIEPDAWERLIEAQRYLASLPILIDDQARLGVPQMRQRARRIRRRYGLDLIVVDHLQLVRQGGRQESRRLEIGDATGMLKAIAKELSVPVLLLSQLSRAPEQRDDKRPILSDLRESGDIEQDADVVMFLYRDEYYLQRAEPKKRPNERAEAFADRLADWEQNVRDARGLAEVNVAKNRHGRTGTARLAFDAERQRFIDLARGW